MSRASHCVRVRPDGRSFETVRDAAGLEAWLYHNRIYRPDDALFVDGRLAGAGDAGALTPEAVEAIERRLREEALAAGELVAAQPGPQKERTSNGWFRWTGYPFECERVPPIPDPA